jgi:hypothetical protein
MASCAAARWNPGGQGESYGEPVRSGMGGDYRYGYQKNEQGPGQQQDWKMYAQGYGSYEGSYSKTQDEPAQDSLNKQKSEESLSFNFTVKGKRLRFESNFGSGNGSGTVFKGSGGGGGGQHNVYLRKGTVRFIGKLGAEGNTVEVIDSKTSRK